MNSPLQELLAEVPQTGRVRWIGVRPERHVPMIELDAVEARLEAGLTGDRARACKTTSGRGLSRPFADMAESPLGCYKVESFDWTIRSASSRFPRAAMLRSTFVKSACSFYTFSNVYS